MYLFCLYFWKIVLHDVSFLVEEFFAFSILNMSSYFLGLPSGSDDKESACNWQCQDATPRLGRSLEKEMATYSNILAWEILWTEDQDRLLPGVAKDMTEHFHFSTAYLSSIVSDEMSAMLRCSSLLGNKQSESHSVMSDSLQLHGLNTWWNSPGQNTVVGSHSLLQCIFSTQGLNPGLPQNWQILYCLYNKLF